MNFGNYNIERTRAPRRRIPWWIYAGAVIIAGLVVWGAIKLLPGRPAEAEQIVETTAETPAVAPAPKAPPAATAPASTPPASPRNVEPAPRPPVTPTPPPPPPSRSPVVTPPPPASPAATAAQSPAPRQPSTPSGSSLAGALAAKNAGDLVKARTLALEVWNDPALAAQRLDAEKILNEVGIALVLSPREMPEKVDYTVQPGDSLDKIAKKFGTTIELIRASNNIRGSMIRAGDRLRVLQGTFSVKVSKSRNDLELYLNDQFFKRYGVGTGEFNKTPVGDFLINDRIAQPTWWRPDGKSIPFGHPENLLGTHWLSINVKGYGLHGTWEPETIGKQASAGCVRMLNSDIEQLFTLLPLGTPVSIRD